MPHMIFELKTISNIDCLRLNAEFFDSIIDLFADENLSEVERNLNFLEKIQILGEKFYSKVNNNRLINSMLMSQVLL
jgi:hypothetical protein